MVRSRGGEGATIAIQTVVSFCGCSFIRLVIFDLVSEWLCFLLLLENIYRVVYDVGSSMCNIFLCVVQHLVSDIIL